MEPASSVSCNWSSSIQSFALNLTSCLSSILLSLQLNTTLCEHPLAWVHNRSRGWNIRILIVWSHIFVLNRLSWMWTLYNWSHVLELLQSCCCPSCSGVSKTGFPMRSLEEYESIQMRLARSWWSHQKCSQLPRIRRTIMIFLSSQ